jgi:anthranilate phosphoribosyltransferase
VKPLDVQVTMGIVATKRLQHVRFGRTPLYRIAIMQTTTWPLVIAAVLRNEDLSVSEATWAMRQVMNGDATPSQLAGFLVALRAKGETVSEIVGFRDAILEAALPLHVDPMALDIVGTGGDQFGTVNVSTMASIVAAAAGIPVIKHGNRAASSSSGSSDVLAALGIDLTLSPERVAETLRRTGITFAFASAFHPGFRHAAATRAELGVPTVFNFLGPLCNPARAEANAVGVAQLDRVPLITGVFRTRGATALVFRGDDGLDELTTTGHSHIWEVSRGDIHEHDLDPRDLGIPFVTIDALRGGAPSENAEVVRRVLDGERGAVRDIVLLNAAAGMVTFKLAGDATQVARPLLERLDEQLTLAAAAIDSGAARAKLSDWVDASAQLAAEGDAVDESTVASTTP